MMAHGKEMTKPTASHSISCDKRPDTSEKCQATKPTSSSAIGCLATGGDNGKSDQRRVKADDTGTRSTSKIKATNDAIRNKEKTGRWTQEENLQFLIGLKIVGAGKWNKLVKYCPKRTQVQIRSHAQKVLVGIKRKGMKDVSSDHIDMLIQDAQERLAGRNLTKSLKKKKSDRIIKETRKVASETSKNGKDCSLKSKGRSEHPAAEKKRKRASSLPGPSLAAAALCSLSSGGDHPEQCSPAAAAGALCYFAGHTSSSTLTDVGETSVAVGALCQLSSPMKRTDVDASRLDAALGICNLLPSESSSGDASSQDSIPADTLKSSPVNSKALCTSKKLPNKPCIERSNSKPPTKKTKGNHQGKVQIVSPPIPIPSYTEENRDMPTSTLPVESLSTSTNISAGATAVTTPRVKFLPTQQELKDMRTPRKQNALETWYERFNELYEYKIHHGDTNVPQQYDANHSLGIWVNKQRMEKKAYEKGHKSSMNQKKIELLESIGFEWAKEKGNIAWGNSFEELIAYKKEHGHTTVPTKSRTHRALGRWVSTQRSMYKRYKDGEAVDSVVRERIKKLEEIGFIWSLAAGEEDAEGSSSSGDDCGDGGLHGDSNHSGECCATRRNGGSKEGGGSSLIPCSNDVDRTDETNVCSGDQYRDCQELVTGSEGLDPAFQSSLLPDIDGWKLYHGADRAQDIVNVSFLQAVTVDQEKVAFKNDLEGKEAGFTCDATRVEASDFSMSEDYDAKEDEAEETDEDDILVI